MTPEAVYAGACLRADLARRGHNRLMVTFDFRTPGRTEFRPLNLSDQFDRNGFDQVMIRSATNDWFINADTEALEAAISQLTEGYDAVHMLGYSMGGYGALRFAKAARATHLVAVSPQATIAPGDVPWDRRYRAEARACDFDAALGALGPRSLAGLRGVIVVDPFRRLDLRHADEIRASFPALHVARLGFGGHPATRALRQAGRAFSVQRVAMDTALGPAFITTAHRQSRRRAACYWQALAEAAAPRRPRLAEMALNLGEKAAANA